MAPAMRFPQGLKRLAVNPAGKKRAGIQAGKIRLWKTVENLEAQTARTERVRCPERRSPSARADAGAGFFPVPT